MTGIRTGDRYFVSNFDKESSKAPTSQRILAVSSDPLLLSKCIYAIVIPWLVRLYVKIIHEL